MRCVAINSSGQVVDVLPQPSDLAACALVIPSPGEVGASPFILANDDAVSIGVAILALWATAFGVRVLVRFLWSS